MSYNGSGVFVINTAGQPVVTGTVISSTAFNALTADLGTGLSTAITKDGQTATTARIPFAAGLSSALVTDTTSGSTGSIFTAGGIGIAKAVYVGTTATVAGTTDSSSTTTGAIITAGGVGVAKALFVGTTANVAGAVTLQSTLAVGGVATYSAQPIFSSLTASSAVATDASKGLVSVTNTGTGDNVLATSPTLVTPILGTPSSGVVTNLTGTASININGTVGATTANTGNFTTLGATGNVTLGDASTDTLNVGNGDLVKDASGNLLVGATATVNARKTLVAYSDVANNGFGINETSGASGAQFQAFFSNGTSCGTIERVGATSAVTYGSTSDYRLKKNILPMVGALEKVLVLKPCTYTWKDCDIDSQGFIAHELAEVCPDAVQGEKDALEEEEYEVTPAVKDEEGGTVTEAVMGTRTAPKYQSIDTSFLVATLTAALQEQQTLITALTARITALETAA